VTTDPPPVSDPTVIGSDAGETLGGSSADGSVDRPTAAADLSLALYDPASFPRFDIELTPAAIATLDLVNDAEDPRQDTYVPATLRHGMETVRDVGLRLKGEGSFQKLDRKPAFKIKFDELVPGQSLYGLRRLTLNNAFEDPSFVAERLAYDVFRAAGLPAPRCNSATVYVNGTFYGVYVNVEAEDKTFLRRWFESDAGNLYEEGQTDFVSGAAAAFNLETNETLNDRSDLERLIAAVQGATNPATFLQDIGTQLDTAQFLKFTAAEAAVNQWDMYAHTVFYVNNLRIYSDPTSGKFAFIPWGMDLSMKPFRDSGKPHISLFALARQGDRPNGPVSSGLIFQRCLQSPACRAAYSDAARAVIAAYEGLNMEARALTYYDQIRSMVLADTRKSVCCGGGPLTNDEFEAGFQSVLSTLRGRVAALRADLAAQ
jgi:spore coat protein CotH